MKLKKFENFEPKIRKELLIKQKKKIFGVRSSDVPQGHEWRHIFPHKFK